MNAGLIIPNLEGACDRRTLEYTPLSIGHTHLSYILRIDTVSVECNKGFCHFTFHSFNSRNELERGECKAHSQFGKVLDLSVGHLKHSSRSGSISQKIILGKKIYIIDSFYVVFSGPAVPAQFVHR